MVGELIGEGAAREETVVGETPNLAARLQALAAPGSVVISQATRRLVGGLFELADLGPRRLKGFAEPLAAWRVEGEGRAEGRFEALHGAASDAAGRARARARACCWNAGAGQGRRGPSGPARRASPASASRACCGRCAQELSGEPHVALSHFCSPYHSNSALYPLIAQLERAAGFARRRPAEARLAKLETLLARGDRSAGRRRCRWSRRCSGCRRTGRYPALNLSPQRQKQRTLEVLIEQLAGLAARAPGALALRGRALGRPDHAGAARPADRARPQPAGAGGAHLPAGVQPAVVGPAARHRAAAHPARPAPGRRYGRARHRGKALPDEVVEQIVARTDGVPLFVEELTKTVLESGLLRDAGDRYELSGPLPPLAIPATLHDSLMARLDRLAPVKEVAQIGAVIGREFCHELLAAVAPLPEAELQRRPRPARRRRADLPPRHPARRDLQLQARPGPGRGVSVAAQVQAPAAACPHRARPGGALRRDGRNAARTAGLSFC